MSLSPSSRLTPWVGRLIIANAVVLLLLMTVFTSPVLLEDIQFTPSGALTRPWTFLTYMFVHAGLLHLLGNMLMLFVFGAPVEGRMGSRKFILYYLYCGIGAAVFSVGLSSFMSVGPFIGASGAVLGVAIAFALFWPDAELVIFPVPIPVKAAPSWPSSSGSTSSAPSTSMTALPISPTWAAPSSGMPSSGFRRSRAAARTPRPAPSSAW
jgi:membrane associated rhomboid family serine protease